MPGLDNLQVSAKKVICSHEHADYSGRECVEIATVDEFVKLCENKGIINKVKLLV